MVVLNRSGLSISLTFFDSLPLFHPLIPLPPKLTVLKANSPQTLPNLSLKQRSFKLYFPAYTNCVLIPATAKIWRVFSAKNVCNNRWSCTQKCGVTKRKRWLDYES